jgi:sugar phosphate isomerase/epimerase
MRRDRLALGLAAAGLLSLAAAAAEAAPQQCAPIPPEKIGLQLFSLLPVLSSPAAPPAAGAPRQRPPLTVTRGALDTAVAAVTAIGYRNVERFGGTLGLPPPAYGAVLAAHGLQAVGSHDGLDPATWDAVLDQAKALGQAYVGSAGFGAPGLATLADTLATAANLNALGKRAADRGLRFYVHNHQAEFTTRHAYDLDGDGRPEMVSAWEIVAANTDPRYVHFEIDVHWARLALGKDDFPALLAFLRRHRDRIELLHVKDTAPDGSITDLGRGVTDWPAVYEAAGPGIRYYLWEFDGPPDPLRSAAVAYSFLRCP